MVNYHRQANIIITKLLFTKKSLKLNAALQFPISRIYSSQHKKDNIPIQRKYHDQNLMIKLSSQHRK